MWLLREDVNSTPDGGLTDLMFQFHLVRADNLESIRISDYSRDKNMFGAPWMIWHRADLHAELRLLATDERNEVGAPAVINLGVPVVDVTESGMVRLLDGRSVQKELIVVANGVWSQLVPKVTGTVPPLQLESRFLRFLVDFDKIKNDPSLSAEFLEKSSCGAYAAIEETTRTLFLTYPCRSRTLLNVVLNVRDDNVRDESKYFGWNSAATRQEVVEAVKPFNATFRALAQKAENPAWFQVPYREPIDKWTKGRIILIGDAAHPMLPVHAQGAATGIEDAAVLGVLFEMVGKNVDIPTLLRKAQEVQMPHVTATQIMSNDLYWGEQAKIEAKIRKFYQGSLPDMTMPQFADTWRQWFCNIDAEDMARLAKVGMSTNRDDIEW